MDDSAGQQRDQASMAEFDIGDYITSTANNDGHQQQDLDFFPEYHQGPGASQMNIQSTITSLGSNHGMEYLSQNQPQTTMITAEMLKGRLEQQIKLQQLQQLQNQILQQQIELISGQSSINDQQKEVIFHGLLTPGPSTELRAMVSKDLVSPMMLQPEMYGPSATAIVNQLSPHHHSINPSNSAPASLAFNTTPPFPLPSPAEPEFDLSPLTSPWLLPVSGAQQQQQRPPRKRAVSSSGDDQGGMRKRSVHSSVLDSRRNGPSASSSSSSASTPAGRSAVLGLAPSFLTPSNDTPSPVDLSMPPPAPPSNINPQTTASSASSSTSFSTPGSTSVSPNIAPVTPASIMNLRPLTTGLVPNAEGKDVHTGTGPRRTGKGKGAVRPGTTAVATRTRRGSLAKPGISPTPKPILPGATAIAPAPTSPLTHPSNSSHASLGSSNFTLSSNGNNIPGPRKTSHKAAEQKRRDSLKTSFDDLRLLLPPVPLPEDAGDEPPLPGSMPPRGPPKGDADGPNRGVSKLALLRCGNTYIRELKDKVTRRDLEIETLRDEVKRLRVLVGDDDAGGEGIDLERDVDEGVVASGYAPGSMSIGEEADLDENKDDE